MEKGEKCDAVQLRANLPTGRGNSHYTLSPVQQVRFHLEYKIYLGKWNSPSVTQDTIIVDQNFAILISIDISIKIHQFVCIKAGLDQI